MGYAFISYSTKNQVSADAIRELFNKHNIDTWMAPYDIPAGSKYAAVITKAIRDCSCFVLLLSNDSQASEAVDSEVELATLTFKKSIITVELEKVILNDAFTFYIHNKQIIAVHKIDEDAHEVKQILDAVRAYTDIKLDINSEFDALREKYPEDADLLDKFLSICAQQPNSLLVYNYDYKKTKEYVDFIKKYIREDVIHIGVTTLINEMIKYIREGNGLDEFYNSYQSCRLLIIEDFQFCAGKETTQETIYQILKYRSDNNLSTIITSCSESPYIAKWLSNLLSSYEVFESTLS